MLINTKVRNFVFIILNIKTVAVNRLAMAFTSREAQCIIRTGYQNPARELIIAKLFEYLGIFTCGNV